MDEPLHKPIDQINEEHPPPGSDQASLPVFVTAAISVFLIVLLAWLFVPGRVAEVRARTIHRPTAGVTAPPARQVREQLQNQRPEQRSEASSQDDSGRQSDH